MTQLIRRICIFGLITLMSFKMVGGFSFNLYFWWNQKQMAAEHCVNKSRPKLKCNGKCYLAKQLAKIENDYQKKQRQPAPFQLKGAELYHLPQQLNPVMEQSIAVEGQKQLFVYSNNHHSTIQLLDSPPPELV